MASSRNVFLYLFCGSFVSSALDNIENYYINSKGRVPKTVKEKIDRVRKLNINFTDFIYKAFNVNEKDYQRFFSKNVNVIRFLEKRLGKDVYALVWMNCVLSFLEKVRFNLRTKGSSDISKTLLNRLDILIEKMFTLYKYYDRNLDKIQFIDKGSLLGDELYYKIKGGF